MVFDNCVKYITKKQNKKLFISKKKIQLDYFQKKLVDKMQNHF